MDNTVVSWGDSEVPASVQGVGSTKKEEDGNSKGFSIKDIRANAAAKKGTDGIDKITAKVDTLTTNEEDGVDEPVIPSSENLINSSSNVEVKFADSDLASNPIYNGVKAFEDLNLDPKLLKGIYAMGFQKPSKIQEKALPLLLAKPHRNMIGQSQAGTGKTAAFALAMLSRIDFDSPTTQAICLAPARELARQIMDNVHKMGKYTQVTTQTAVRESVQRGQKVNAHIVIGTPGTVLDLIKKRAIDTSNVKIFVLDEADNMLDQQGLGEQSKRAQKLMPKDVQLVLFSATFTPEVRQFASTFAPNANEISLKREELSVDGIKQFYMDCNGDAHRLEVLQAIYGLLTIGQSIIFVRTRNTADLIAQEMTKSGHSVCALHGRMEAEERDKVMDDFRDGKFKVLVSTNVLSRGIDILQVTLVINYDMPVDQERRPDPETYLHRIGRTGRFGRTGVSINFVWSKASFEEMAAIQEFFGREIVRVPTENYAEIEKILKKAVK